MSTAAAVQVKAAPFIVDPILPTNEVHLVGGPSGVGKTTWLIQALHHISLGTPVLDYPSLATEWTYVSCDRSGPGMERTLDRLSLPIERQRFHTRREFPRDAMNQLAGIKHIIEWCPTPLLILEAFTLLMPVSRNGGSNTYHDVGSWLSEVSDLCQRHHVTILGTVHSPKSRENERYPDMRQRVLGSVAFAALVETIFLIERESNEPEDNRRVLYLLPRNSKERAYHFQLDLRGRFVSCLAPSEGDIEIAMEALFATIPEGAEIDASAFRLQAENRGVSKTSYYRWLTCVMEAGRIERVRHGTYRKTRPS